MTTRSLVSAATRYTTRRTTAKAPDQSWQETAWDYYSNTPEVRFAATWVGNAMSGARLFAGRRAADGTVERAPDDHAASLHVASIAGGIDGQSEMLRAFGKHLVVPGEGWIVILPKGDDTQEWRVLSVLEMSSKGKGLEAEIDGEMVVIPPNDPDVPDDPNAPIAIRVWDPHPRRHLEADSPVRAALDLLEELRLLNAAVKAITRSRLTGRGIVIVPQGVRFPTTTGQSDAEDDLIDVFMEVSETAIRDPDSAAATVPIILEVPKDAVASIQRLTFESNFDELAIRLREEAIRRFATGMDIPAEILLGLGDSNHWAAWALQEEAIRLGVEPRLGTVVHALTTQWLRPVLEDEGLKDAGEWLVWYDTSPLRVRANRSQTALEVYDRGELSGEALRRETGFDEADAPAAQPQQPQDQAEDEDTEANGQEDSADEQESPAAPRLPSEETTGPPDTLQASIRAGEGLLAAADGLIWNALNRAGEKLRRTPACPRSRRTEANQMSAAALHTLLPVDITQVTQWGLLDDAFDRADEIAGRYGTSPDCLRASLHGYCAELLAAGVEHDYAHVAQVITPCLQDIS